MGDLAAGNAWIQRVLGVTVGAGAPPSANPLAIWGDAKDLAGEQIGRLQGALRNTKHPLFIRIADQGLNGITGRLQVGLQSALMDYDRAAGDARTRARQKAQGAVTEFRGFLQTDPALPLLESNPFGVAVTLRATLGDALDAIDSVLAA